MKKILYNIKSSKEVRIPFFWLSKDNENVFDICIIRRHMSSCIYKCCKYIHIYIYIANIVAIRKKYFAYNAKETENS